MRHLINRRLKIAMIASGLLGLSTLTFNCSPSLFQSAKPHQNIDFSSVGAAGMFDKPNSPYSLMTSHQIFSSMLNVTGQNGEISANMRAEFESRTGSLPDNDSLTSLSAPVQLAATSVAGEVCNNLLTREQSLAADSRKYFKQVDFARNLASNNAAGFSAAVSAMASSYWGRNLSQSESQILNDYYTDFAASYGATGNATEQVRTTRKLYLSTCAAMLSSFDSLVQ